MPSTDRSRFLAPALTAVAVVVLIAPVAVALTSQDGYLASPRTPRAQPVADVTGEAGTTTAPSSSGGAPTPSPPSPAPSGSPSPPSPVALTAPDWLRRPGAAGQSRGPVRAPGHPRPPVGGPGASTPGVTTLGGTATIVAGNPGGAPGTASTSSDASTAAPTRATTTVTTTAVPTTTVTVTVGAPGPTSSAGGSVTSASGWHSGASGAAASNGSFGAWRGKPVQVIAIWGDTTAAEQTNISALGPVDGFDGDLDVAVGGLAAGETWSQAAQGAYTSRWRQAVRTIAAHRSGKPGTTYVRFAHEMNGNWFTWKVNSSNLADFHTSWRLFHDILAQEYPAAKLVFSPNSGTHSDVTVSQIYPGDDVVDVISVDFYDGWPSVVDQAGWDGALYATEQGGQPRGVGSWQRFAQSHGKPLAFSEWGLQFGDHPAYIKAMHDFLVTHAARAGDADLAGKVIYDIYFDIAHGGNAKFMLSGSANPQAAAMYRSLSWGS